MRGNAMLPTGLPPPNHEPVFYTYAPKTYDRETLEEAARACISAGGGLTLEDRWNIETQWIMNRVSFDPGPVIDYGCGVGRIAKALLDRGQQAVCGVDHSPTMRRFAVEYVNSERFFVVAPELLDEAANTGFVGAIAVWTLHHILEVRKAVDAIAKALKPGSLFWTLDLGDRHIPAGSPTEPASVGSVLPDDGVRVYPVIESTFVLEATTKLDIWTAPVGNPGELRKWRRK